MPLKSRSATACRRSTAIEACGVTTLFGNKVKPSILLISILSFSFAYAQDEKPFADRKLDIRSEGDIIGLPARFLPARFDLKLGELTIGGSKLKLSNAIMSLFANDASFSGVRTIPDAGSVTLALEMTTHVEADVIGDALCIRWKNKGGEHWFSVLVDFHEMKVREVAIEVREAGFDENSPTVRHLPLLLPKDKAENAGARQIDPPPESDSEGRGKPQHEAE